MASTTSLQITNADDGWFHVNCRTLGSSIDEAKAAAEFALNALATGKLAMIRTEPRAAADKCFDTKETTFKGAVRFSFRDEAGEWHRPSESPSMADLSLSGS